MTKERANGTNFYNRDILEIFHGSLDLDQFFINLKAKYTTSELCLLCSPWIDELVNQHIFDNKGNEFRDGWYIYRETIAYRYVSNKIVLDNVNQHPKKTTNQYSYEIIKEIREIKKERELLSQAGGNKKHQQVYLRILNLDGTTTDIYLGNYNTYKLNIDKYLPEDGHIAVGMLVYK